MLFKAVVADVRHFSRNFRRASTRGVILTHTLLVQVVGTGRLRAIRQKTFKRYHASCTPERAASWLSLNLKNAATQ